MKMVNRQVLAQSSKTESNREAHKLETTLTQGLASSATNFTVCCDVILELQLYGIIEIQLLSIPPDKLIILTSQNTHFL